MCATRGRAISGDRAPRARRTACDDNYRAARSAALPEGDEVMDARDRAAAAAALLDARRAARTVATLPAAWPPATLDDALAIQRAISEATGAVRGWKVSAVTAEQQRAMGLAGPI